MKGQISVEAVLAMALMLALYATIIAWAMDIGVQDDEAVPDTKKLPILIEAAHSKGPGTRVDIEVYDGFETAPGLMIMRAPDGDTYPQAVDPAAVRDNMTVRPDTYTLEVTDDGVSFH